MILPSNARTTAVSPSSLDSVNVREFYRARGGARDVVDEDTFDYLMTCYVRAVDGQGYSRLVAEYRSMLTAEINERAARLAVSLPYPAYKSTYDLYGLSGSPAQVQGRLREYARTARQAREAYAKAAVPAKQDDGKPFDWVQALTREVAVLSRYLGFAVDPDKTSAGVYFGYLSLMDEEASKAKKDKA